MNKKSWGWETGSEAEAWQAPSRSFPGFCNVCFRRVSAHPSLAELRTSMYIVQAFWFLFCFLLRTSTSIQQPFPWLSLACTGNPYGQRPKSDKASFNCWIINMLEIFQYKPAWKCFHESGNSKRKMSNAREHLSRSVDGVLLCCSCGEIYQYMIFIIISRNVAGIN